MPTVLVVMYWLGSPATTPPLASTASLLTTIAVRVLTTEFRNHATGALSVTSKVKSSTTLVDSMLSLRVAESPSARFMVIARSHEYFTSSAVRSVPSWNLTPSRMGKV